MVRNNEKIRQERIRKLKNHKKLLEAKQEKKLWWKLLHIQKYFEKIAVFFALNEVNPKKYATFASSLKAQMMIIKLFRDIGHPQENLDLCVGKNEATVKNLNWWIGNAIRNVQAYHHKGHMDFLPTCHCWKCEEDPNFVLELQEHAKKYLTWWLLIFTADEAILLKYNPSNSHNINYGDLDIDPYEVAKTDDEEEKEVSFQAIKDAPPIKIEPVE